MSNLIELPVRYLRMQGPEESLFRHEGKKIKLLPEETAFVLVDVWDLSQVPESKFPGLRSFGERVFKITEEKIKPALDVARKLGLTVVHAPTNYVSVKYPQYHRLKQELNLSKPASSRQDDWPPQDFARDRRREFEEDRYWKNFEVDNELRCELTDIIESVKPLDDEYVISTGREMNEVLKMKTILNLIYVGFATNICLIQKPGAMREMGPTRGYRTILIRDCTTAVETHNTVKDLVMTKLWIEWIEMEGLGYTTTSDDFIKAIDKLDRISGEND